MYFSRLLIVVLLCVAAPVYMAVSWQSSEGGISAYDSAKSRMDQIVRDREYRGSHISDLLLELARYQDTLLAFLYESQTVAEYLDGMARLHVFDTDIRLKVGDYVTWIFNFHSPTSPRIEPQRVEVEVDGCVQEGYLNTFKKGRELTAHEREVFFTEEMNDYLEDGVVEPFVLDEDALPSLEPEAIYNFALLPDGTIHTALERLGRKQFRVRDGQLVAKMTHPNHTILAGSPHQPVLTAGSILMFQDGAKRLFFVSNKSGHFIPPYLSLDVFKQHFAKLGVEENTIILVPDVDLAYHTLREYGHVEVPILVTEYNASRMFQRAHDLWVEAYRGVDKQAVQSLADGDLDMLSDDLIDKLGEARLMAITMRSAYRLFGATHSVPEVFNQFVTQFGRLRDAIHFDAYDKIQSEAIMVSALMNAYADQIEDVKVDITDERSFHDYFEGRTQQLRSLLDNEVLHKEDYNQVNMISFELGVLFKALAEDNKLKGRDFFLYRATSSLLFNTQKLISEVYDAYVRHDVKGDRSELHPYITVQERVYAMLNKCIAHFALEPPHFDLGLNKQFSRKLVARAVHQWNTLHDKMSWRGVGKWHPETSELMLQIMNHDVHMNAEQMEGVAADLERLHGRASVVRRGYMLLASDHAAPDELECYLNVIEQLIDVLRNHPQHLDQMELQASWLYAFLGDLGWPKHSFVFEGDDQEGIETALQLRVQDLMAVAHSETIGLEDFSLAIEAAHQLHDLFNLMRMDHIGESIENDRTLSRGCYDNMSRALEHLLDELESSWERHEEGDVRLSENAQRIAQHVVNKLGTGETVEPLMAI